jgi:hypothetical protein
MRNTSFVVVVFAVAVVACGTVRLSAAQPPQNPSPAASPATAAPPPPAAPPAAPAESRRDEVRAMEVFLMQALQKGAQDLARQLRMNEPNSAFVTGTGRARGFVLEGYGMFFDVDVPGMKQSVVWSAQMLQLAQDRQNYLRFLASAAPDDPRRKFVDEQLKGVERLMVQQTGTILLTNPTANTEMVPPARGLVGAATVPVADATGARPSPVPQVEQLRDPNELYTDSVKKALIDVMLRHSAFLKIRESEWLTVAASDSDGPQQPGQVDELSRILLSIRGVDLLAFQSGRLTREEVLKRIEVREF